MKKILFALSMLALVASALPRAARADVSVDFFYNNLSGGNWIEVEGYGYGWQPDVAVSDPNWRPTPTATGLIRITVGRGFLTRTSAGPRITTVAGLISPITAGRGPREPTWTG